ncbi:hypothetical protein JI664_22425, partial [Rhodobacter sp. NTK016B]|nr:hypothetical protein [Rhodobacter sp. NTK016B]
MVGIRTTNLNESSVVDDLIGNYNGNTVRVSLLWLLAAMTALSGPSYQTRAELYADLTWPDGAQGYVTDDGTSAFNGRYRKDGAAGAGSWTRIGDLPSGGPSAAELATKAPINSPDFSGIPLVDTAAPGTNNRQAASTAFVQAAISALIAAAPGALNTLNELAAALGDDPNFAATIAGQIGDLEAARGFDALIRPAISGTGDAAVATVATEQAEIGIANGTPFLVRWPAANTVTAPTLTVGATEYTILNQNGGALAAGDLGSARWYWMVQHSSSPARLKLLGVVNAAELGLGEVDNTRDEDKPVSTAQAATFEAEALVGARQSGAGKLAPAMIKFPATRRDTYASGGGSRYQWVAAWEMGADDRIERITGYLSSEGGANTTAEMQLYRQVTASSAQIASLLTGYELVETVQVPFTGGGFEEITFALERSILAKAGERYAVAFGLRDVGGDLVPLGCGYSVHYPSQETAYVKGGFAPENRLDLIQTIGTNAKVFCRVESRAAQPAAHSIPATGRARGSMWGSGGGSGAFTQVTFCEVPSNDLQLSAIGFDIQDVS